MLIFYVNSYHQPVIQSTIARKKLHLRGSATCSILLKYLHPQPEENELIIYYMTRDCATDLAEVFINNAIWHNQTYTYFQAIHDGVEWRFNKYAVWWENFKTCNPFKFSRQFCRWWRWGLYWQGSLTSNRTLSQGYCIGEESGTPSWQWQWACCWKWSQR